MAMHAIHRPSLFLPRPRFASMTNPSEASESEEPSSSADGFSSAPELHDPWAALRIPGFRRYLAGNIFAALGMQMQTVAVGWEVWERTHDALLLGMVGLVQFLPVISLLLLAGHAAD